MRGTPKAELRQENMVAFIVPHGVTHWGRYRNWQLYINQGWREAELLAVCGFSFLFDYEMPNGKYYLHAVNIEQDGAFASVGKSVSHKHPSKKWIHDAEWIADPSDYLMREHIAVRFRHPTRCGC